MFSFLPSSSNRISKKTEWLQVVVPRLKFLDLTAIRILKQKIPLHKNPKQLQNIVKTTAINYFRNQIRIEIWPIFIKIMLQIKFTDTAIPSLNLKVQT